VEIDKSEFGGIDGNLRENLYSQSKTMLLCKWLDSAWKHHNLSVIDSQ
jgi:hypothetical protein